METARQTRLRQYAHAFPFTTEKQLEHRAQLVDAWDIPEGATVLEVGCGQGDTTLVLATVVGPNGRVVAVDNASGDYGEPESLDEAHAKIVEHGLPCPVSFVTECDISATQTPSALHGNTFDCAVFAHSAWYTDSEVTLRRLFETVANYAPRLAFAEWSLLGIGSISQLPHLCAVLTQQALISQHGLPTTNVRTPLSAERLLYLAQASGWRVYKHDVISPPSDLEDARWEIEIALKMLSAVDDLRLGPLETC